MIDRTWARQFAIMECTRSRPNSLISLRGRLWDAFAVDYWADGRHWRDTQAKRSGPTVLATGL